MIDVIGRFTKGFSQRAHKAWARHPVEIVLGLTMAFVLSLLIEQPLHRGIPESLQGLVLMAPVVWVLVFAVSTLALGKAVRWATQIGLIVAAVVFGVFYGAVIFDVDVTAHWWNWLLMSSAAVFGLLATALLIKDREATREVGFWRFTSRLVIRGGVCGVYLSLLFVGLLVGMVMVDVLLGITVGERWVAHLAVWLFVGAGPWMVVAGHEEVMNVDRPIPEAAVRWIARLGSFLLLPLIVLYLLITYGYALRVTFTDFAPSNVISPLVLGAGILGFLGLYLVQPLRHREDYALLSRLYQLFPVAFLMVLPLSVWALFERINQYGWTEFRYLRLLAVVLFAILCVQGFVQFVRKRAMDLWTVPVVLGAGCLFALVGPWSATNVAHTSQLNRLVEVSDDLGLVSADGTIDPDAVQALDWQETGEIREVVRYLDMHHGPESMEELVPTGEGLNAQKWSSAMRSGHRSSGVGRHDRGRTVELDRPLRRQYSLSHDGDLRVNQSGLLSSFRYGSLPEQANSPGGQDREWVDRELRELMVERGGVMYHAPVDELLDYADEATRENSDAPLPEEWTSLPLYGPHEVEAGEVLIEELRVVREDDQPAQFREISGYVVIDDERSGQE